MPTLSVVTPVHGERTDYLADAYESLRSQKLPANWDWEWLVQEDGETGVLSKILPEDPRISVGQGRRGRAGTARRMAHTRASGVLTRCLDADDQLTEGALWRDIEALTAHPEIVWTVSAATDLYPDGSTKTGPYDPPEGALPAGLIREWHRDDKMPVVGTTLCTYTELVHAVGGWDALPASEDIGLLLAVEAVSPGWMLATPGVVWRKWPGQSTAVPQFQDSYEYLARKTSVLARADSLTRTGWRWTPRDPLPDLEDRSTVTCAPSR